MSDISITLNREQIARCESFIRPYVRRTPIIGINGADVGVNSRRLCLKLELFQHSGSFKARGAFTNLLLRNVPAAGRCRRVGWQPRSGDRVCRNDSEGSSQDLRSAHLSPAKVARIREYGADLVIEGDRYADALAASEAWVEKSGAMAVHAFDQYETMLGQGTIGQELTEQAPDIDTLFVSVGGGGLIAGIATWYAGAIKVIGVEPFASPTLTKALEAGRPVDAEAGGLAADSLALRRVGENVFPIAKA